MVMLQQCAGFAPVGFTYLLVVANTPSSCKESIKYFSLFKIAKVIKTYVYMSAFTQYSQF